MLLTKIFNFKTQLNYGAHLSDSACHHLRGRSVLAVLRGIYQLTPCCIGLSSYKKAKRHQIWLLCDIMTSENYTPENAVRKGNFAQYNTHYVKFVQSTTKHPYGRTSMEKLYAKYVILCLKYASLRCLRIAYLPRKASLVDLFCFFRGD